MADNQTRPVGQNPSPTTLGLTIGLPIGLGLVFVQIAKKAATEAGGGSFAAMLISVVAAAIVAGDRRRGGVVGEAPGLSATASLPSPARARLRQAR